MEDGAALLKILPSKGGEAEGGTRREMETLSSPVVRSMAFAISPVGGQSHFSHSLVRLTQEK